MTVTDEQKLGGVGASEIGKLFTQKGVKAKTAQTLIREKAQEMIDGRKVRSKTTAAQAHGHYNEEEAFHLVVKSVYPNAVYQSADSIHIKEGLWATPDVWVPDPPVTIDIKCPYTIPSYHENVRKLPATYISQNQCQMLATGHKKGFVCIYLTSPDLDPDTYEKIEYNIPINDRHAFIPIDAHEEYHKEIHKRFDEFKIQRDKLYEDMLAAINISDHELHYLSFENTSKITMLKDKSNMQGWGGMLLRNRENYYVIQLN